MYFVTSNKGKFIAAQKLIPGLKHVNLNLPEIQSESNEEIAVHSVKYAFQQLREPCFVDDSGFYVEALNGFPGPYSKYVFNTIGNTGVLKLMQGVENRKAWFEACIAYHDGNEIHVFKGRADGTIAYEMRGNQYGSFGFDPVFIPNGWEKTFAEDIDHKDKVSHRRKALDAFIEFLKNKKANLYKEIHVE